MSDPRFFKPAGPFTLNDLASKIGAVLADPAQGARTVKDIADLGGAGENDLALFSSIKLAPDFAVAKAGAIITTKKLGEQPHKAALLYADDPKLAFALAGKIFHPAPAPHGFVHHSASVAASASIGADCHIAAGVVIGENVVIGPRSRIGGNTVIETGVVIGADAVIASNVSISHAVIGEGVDIAPNSTIGGEGFGFVPGPKSLVRLTHVGRVVIGNQVVIGANCAIDRGALGDTVIGDMTALDNLVQIGHNVKIGKACVFAGQSGVAGSVTIGDGVMVGGGVSISDHLTIGSGAKIAGKSGVAWDVAPGEIVAGYPAVPVRQWHRQSAALAKLIQKKED